jgi:hypothetical protein
MLFPGNILSMLKNEVGKFFGEIKFTNTESQKHKRTYSYCIDSVYLVNKQHSSLERRQLNIPTLHFFSQIIFVYLIFLK